MSVRVGLLSFQSLRSKKSYDMFEDDDQGKQITWSFLLGQQTFMILYEWFLVFVH